MTPQSGKACEYNNEEDDDLESPQPIADPDAKLRQKRMNEANQSDGSDADTLGCPFLL